MAERRVIENRESGERITVLESAAETGGRRLSFELELAPGARVPAAHAHPRQREAFMVVEGRVRFRVGWRSSLLSEGERVVVPRGATHSFVNVGSGAAKLLVVVEPPLRTEELLATAAQLASPRRRLRLAADLVAFLREFEPEVAVPFLPSPVARVAVAALAGAARVTRLDRRYRNLREAAP